MRPPIEQIETIERGSITCGRRGYYTLEAAIFLPLIVLAVLSLGYFTRVDGIWENCVHCAADESGRAQAMAYDGISGYATRDRIRRRISAEPTAPDSFSIRSFRVDYSDGVSDHLSSFELTADVRLDLPAGFSRSFSLEFPLLYRNFVGREIRGEGLGISGLEDGQPGDPVSIFPAYGEKYHDESCTHVRSTARAVIVTGSVRRSHEACKVCRSGDIPTGGVAFAFESSGSAYHRGSCRTLQRHVIVIDRGEAEQRGYGPCSKCGGGGRSTP